MLNVIFSLEMNKNLITYIFTYICHILYMIYDNNSFQESILTKVNIKTLLLLLSFQGDEVIVTGTLVVSIGINVSLIVKLPPTELALLLSCP